MFIYSRFGSIFGKMTAVALVHMILLSIFDEALVLQLSVSFSRII